MRTQRKRIKTCGLASKRIARSRRDEDNMADLPWTDCASIKTATALTNNPLLYIHIFFPNFKFRQVSQHLNKQKLAENLNGKKKKIRPQLLVQSVSRVGFEGENLNNFCLAFSRRFKRVHRARHKIVKHSIVVVERLWRCAMTFNESSRDTSSSDGVWLATDLKRQGFRTANGAAAKAGS